MAFTKRKSDVEKEPSVAAPIHSEDTLTRIEAVTDRLEWLAEQIERQLSKRENRDG